MKGGSVVEFETFHSEIHDINGPRTTHCRRYRAGRAGEHIEFICLGIDPCLATQRLIERTRTMEHPPHIGNARHIPLGHVTVE